MQNLDLSSYKRFDNNGSFLLRVLWLGVHELFFRSWIPGSAWRAAALRLFGAKVGRSVVIKPGVRVKYPWKISIGDFCWMGEDVWVDNIEFVSIGSHCCLSQAAYFCTGNHDWSKGSFDLIAKPICLKEGVWIGARAVVGPGVTVGKGAILCLQSVATGDLDEWSIYQGNPAKFIKKRTEMV